MTKKALSDKQIDRIEKFANSMVWFCVGSYVTAILYEAVIRVNDKKQQECLSALIFFLFTDCIIGRETLTKINKGGRCYG